MLEFTLINQLHTNYFNSNGNLHLGEMSLGIISDAISLEVFLTGRGNSLPAIDLSVTK